VVLYVKNNFRILYHIFLFQIVKYIFQLRIWNDLDLMDVTGYC